MPMRPRLWMKPGMMPILHWPGAMMPGQLGPTRRVLFCDLSIDVMRTMSGRRCERARGFGGTGGPATNRVAECLGNANDEGNLSLEGLLDAGSGQGWALSCQPGIAGIVEGRVLSYGTKRAVAVAPVSLTASETSLKTGRFKCVWPAFLGFVPPTTLVPGEVSGVQENFNTCSYRIQWPAGRGSWSRQHRRVSAKSQDPGHVRSLLAGEAWKMTLVSPLMRRFSIVLA